MKAACAGCGCWRTVDNGLCFLCRPVGVGAQGHRSARKPRRPKGEGVGSCATCGRPTPHGDYVACALHDGGGPVVCECPDPTVDGLGECQSCHRKPARLLGLVGRDAFVAAGARVVPTG